MPDRLAKPLLPNKLQLLIKNLSYNLDLENPADTRKLSDPYTFLTENKNNCIIIDEVQTIPSLFAVLRSVIDENRKNGKFILLGSASPELACIEVKLNNAPAISKGNYQSLADLKTKKNFVVVPDVEEYRTKKNIIICSIDTLLSKYLPEI